MSSELPRPLGPYLLLRHLASGGMGEVYLAHLAKDQRVCVVKTIRPEIALDDTMLQRFLDEAKTSAYLTHKNVAEVFDVGQHEGLAYMAVEHVAGRDLQSVIRKSKRESVPIPLEVSLHIAAELLDGLAYVHAARHPHNDEPLRIVHRDISPHNVMVAFGGDVKIIDFGIARSSVKRDVTQAGQAVGKVRYMAPEQARAESVTSAADIWAACLVLTELFTGKRFWGDLPVETILLRVATGMPPKSEALNALPDSLRRAISRGLDLDPKKRPSASALKATILAAVDKAPSASTTRSLMAALYAGEEQEEERARTALIQEPTTVRANALWSRTASEDTPPGELDVDTAAPTASRIAVDPDVAARLFRDADDDVSSTDESAAGSDDESDEMSADDAIVEERPSNPRLPSGARARQKRETSPRTRTVSPSVRNVAAPSKRGRNGVSIAAIVAGIAACGVVVLAFVLIGRAAAENDPPSSTQNARPMMRPPIVVEQEDPAMAAALAPADAGTPLATTTPTPTPTVADAGTPTTTTTTTTHVDGVKPRVEHNEHVEHRTHTKAHDKPVLFGERVKALRACAKPPPCAQPVLRRAADVASLSPDELRALTEDVDWCLGQCR